MLEPKGTTCRGHQSCKRKTYTDGLCEFHLPSDHKSALKVDKYNALLIEDIKNTAEKEDGTFEIHWEAFNFPVGHVLFSNIDFESVREILSKSWISLADSNIQNIQVETLEFDNLIFSRATINGNTLIGVTGINNLRIPHAKFKGKFHCASISNVIDARSAVFEREFSFSSTVNSLVNFGNCRFNDSCSFFGGAGHIFGSDSDDYFKVAGFDNAIFAKPTQTIFQDVNLKKASFKSVPLIGVRFYNTEFYQEELKRNGLYNDIREIQRKNPIKRKWFKKKIIDERSRARFRHLIHEYRQIRMAMENNKDFVKAHDFYIGEMEARQQRDWSFLLYLYNFSSKYGTNYVRAISVLLSLFLFHIFLTTIISTDLTLQQLCTRPNLSSAWESLGEISLHSFGTGTLQRIGLLKHISGWQAFIDIVFRILIPIQAAMFVLALRNKTKR